LQNISVYFYILKNFNLQFFNHFIVLLRKTLNIKRSLLSFDISFIWFSNLSIVAKQQESLQKYVYTTQ